MGATPASTAVRSTVTTTRCTHDMVATWCAWCLGLPDVPLLWDAADDSDDPADLSKCARCTRMIRPGEDIGRDENDDALCWRCAW